MRLTDLDPRWLACNQDGRFGMGVSFISPVSTARVTVWFENPIDGMEHADGDRPLYKRTGENFATLTLWPLIYAEAWRGFVKDGRVTSV